MSEVDALMQRLRGRTYDGRAAAGPADAISRGSPVLADTIWRPWSDEELKILRDHYRTIGLRGCRPLLPGRTSGAIRMMARRFGLTTPYRSPWSAEELQILRDHYQRLGVQQIAKLLPGRTAGAIRQMAKIAGVAGHRRGRGHWSDEELQILRDHYRTAGLRGCCELLPGRTAAAIRLRITTLGYGKGSTLRRATDILRALLEAPELAGRGDLRRRIQAVIDEAGYRP